MLAADSASRKGCFLMPAPLPMLRYLAVSAVFCVVWLNLHLAAAVFEIAPMASVWYPARGLSLALLLIFGLPYAPALFVASLIGGVDYHLPAHPENWLGSAGLITLAMAAAAWTLRRMDFTAGLRLKDAAALIVVSALACLLIALGMSALFLGAGTIEAPAFADLAFQFFVGDYLGVLIVVPPALLLARLPTRRRSARPRRLELGRGAGEALLLVGTAAAVLWLAVDEPRLNTGSTFGRWYLLLLPLALAAIRFGPPGAAAATLALSVAAVAVARDQGLAVHLVDLQLLLLAFSAASLLLGSAVADRERTREELAAVLRREAERARREAVQARQSMARFMAATTHDLRPPFEAVRLGLETLRLQNLPAETQAVVQRAESAARSLARVLESVLDTARLEGEIRAASPRVVALQPLLRRVAVEAAAVHPLPERALAVIPTSLRAITDPLLLERLLRNLVSNALRASALSGRVVLGCRRRGMMVRLEVHDTGCGIEPERIDGIFEPFVSGHAGGSGIGLSLVREISEELGVGLAVRSRLARGTVFSLELPLTAPTRGQPALAAARAAVRDRVIAIAVNRPVRRELLAAVLSDWGAAVVTGGDSDTVAAELAQLGSRADLLVVDEPVEDVRPEAVDSLELASAAPPLRADLAAIASRLR